MTFQEPDPQFFRTAVGTGVARCDHPAVARGVARILRYFGFEPDAGTPETPDLELRISAQPPAPAMMTPQTAGCKGPARRRGRRSRRSHANRGARVGSGSCTTRACTRPTRAPSCSATKSCRSGAARIRRVEEGVRRRGIGRRLVARAQRWLRDEGAERLRLGVAARNVAARRFWRRLGFRPYRLRYLREL